MEIIFFNNSGKSLARNANDLVKTLLVSGGTVYVGGTFTSIGGEVRNRIAALDAVTGSLTAWNPNANEQVNALAASGSTVYAGGVFSLLNGLTLSSFGIILIEPAS
ncbi:PQQ-binding-like beta-propeller repeat protein [uncultured Legionella sp.]|uniref:PQQ-binding-like beta-propeller repeat protein n=1 Tax=uncultured Legionella sp. TaxID=210934 RepID=UPI00262C6468|nr:PQQ-binding-like beta-propeller repeat protein [uncultured Legionella sp.]